MSNIMTRMCELEWRENVDVVHAELVDWFLRRYNSTHIEVNRIVRGSRVSFVALICETYKHGLYRVSSVWRFSTESYEAVASGAFEYCLHALFEKTSQRDALIY